MDKYHNNYCVIPNCNEGTSGGITFPKNLNIQTRWLKSLDIPNFTVKDSSFICLKHFQEKGLMIDPDIPQDSNVSGKKHFLAINIKEDIILAPVIDQSTQELLQTLSSNENSQEDVLNSSNNIELNRELDVNESQNSLNSGSHDKEENLNGKPLSDLKGHIEKYKALEQMAVNLTGQ